MKVLVIGGTQFIGRHVVTKLLDCGHSVTLVNRGKTSPQLFTNLPRISVDRETDAIFKAIGLRQNWDAVIDLCAYYPKDVRNILEILRGKVKRYVLCSTLSAYEASSLDGPTPMIVEGDSLRTCSEQEAVDTTLATYGQRKAECERVAMSQSQVGIPVVIIRPCVVFGAYDYTDRFAYWIWRASRKEPFILPDDGLTLIRRTYAPDLAAAFVKAIDAPGVEGKAYNIAESDPLNFRDTLFYIGKHIGTNPLEYAKPLSGDFLLKQGVLPWVDLPLWIPKTNLLVDTFRSRCDLSFVSTPSASAIAAASDAFLSEGREPKTGISTVDEKEILHSVKRSL